MLINSSTVTWVFLVLFAGIACGLLLTHPSTTAWAWLGLLVATGLVNLTLSCKRPTALAVWGIGMVFFSVPLSRFFAFLATSYAPTEVIEAWLFSFRFLGASLFVWGMCDGIGQRIDTLSQALKGKHEDRTPQ